MSDVLSLEEYEKKRPILRRQIIELKEIRRVALGDNISVVFENFQTMLWQTQEMLRAERITDPELIQEELDTYNELIPDANELRATLFIELPDSQNIPRDLPRFIGVEETVSLTFGGQAVKAEAEPGRSTEEKTATVHYLRFPFTPEQVQAFGSGPAQLKVEHANYSASTELGEATIASLKEDLTAA
ncbi:MAG TPA: DUF3501 family protein [Chloroflexota bacterium]|nr:DUF3501 family protein [Chloroflexota bacterium]